MGGTRTVGRSTLSACCEVYREAIQPPSYCSWLEKPNRDTQNSPWIMNGFDDENPFAVRLRVIRGSAILLRAFILAILSLV